MAPEVVLRKLATLRRLLDDLRPFADATRAEVDAEHYRIERILELLATVAADLLQHLLAERGVVADSYRDVFRRAAGEGLIDAALGARLERAAGMRNVLVHLYDGIDLEIVRQAIAPALVDFALLIAALEPLAQPGAEGG